MNYLLTVPMTHPMEQLIAAIERSSDVPSIQEPPTDPAVLQAILCENVRASVALEQSALSLEEVTMICKGEHTDTFPEDALAVRNLLDASLLMPSLDPWSLEDLLKVQEIISDGIPEEFDMLPAGILHRPEDPKAALAALLKEAQESTLPVPLLSCLVHCSILLMKPFGVGSGRLARLWQTLILSKWKPCFGWLPLTKEYMNTLDLYMVRKETALVSGNVSLFVEYLLNAILRTLDNARVSPADLIAEA